MTNTSSSPALLLAVNTAPKVINMYQSKSFVFENEFNFEDRFGGNLEDYWKPGEDFEPQPVRGRAMITTNLIPEAATTYLPLDNNRGPGHRWLAPNMVGNTVLQGWIAEYPSGRYAKAHHHSSGAVLVCMRGKGYSITWPEDVGGLNGEDPGEGGEQIQTSLTDIDKGGRAIPYYMEDPHIRTLFKEKLAENNAQFTMPDEVYTKEGSNIKVMSE